MWSSIPHGLPDRLMNEAVPSRESVYRVLLRLFNTRNIGQGDGLPPLLVRGVPEWHEMNVGDERVLGWFCRQLRSDLPRLEPRIAALRVEIKDISQQKLALHIEAHLWDDDAPLQLRLIWQNGNWQPIAQEASGGSSSAG
ncbi:GPW/gp25 family protein [Intestinirhabdus alba]|jgi:predicted component of type VI protein secretion system|uniref:DNA recombination protein n=1 Tax=Intestinirhabdus alba TaxID=2899544 RepID=A0A6L6ISF6_9ENTR|nr:GPW/gp25 family protein [Intestinirhabdus alba]MTH48658.1 DNA recombination protein [Intestinirhabdus alba]